MSAKIIKSPEAKLDLGEQAGYIAQDNIDAALRFLDAAERDFAFLAGRPGAGVGRKFRRKELAGVRSWLIGGFENHVIFYRLMREGIEIIRVLHGMRNIAAILDS